MAYFIAIAPAYQCLLVQCIVLISKKFNLRVYYINKEGKFLKN